MPKCTGCNSALSHKEQITCCLCKLKYDLLCANISIKRFQAMDQEHKRTWKCPECRNKLPKTDNTNTPVRSAGPIQELAEELESSVDTQSSNITQRRKAVATLNAAPELQPNSEICYSKPLEIPSIGEVGKFWTELQATRLVLTNLTTTLSELTVTMKESNERMDRLETRIQLLEGKNSGDKQLKIDSLEARIAQLEQNLEDRDQDMLSNDVDLAGIPEEKGEGVMHIVITAALKLGVELNDCDVVSAERVGPSRNITEGGPPPPPRAIAVRFTRRSTRTALLQASRARRGVTTADMGLAGPPRRFYVNERLTKRNRLLFRRAREVAGQTKWRYVWTRDGRIYARREDGGNRYRIGSLPDIARVFGCENVCSDD